MGGPRRAAPLCFRLPPDLHAAVASMAENAGISTSEWVRITLHQIVYGQPPGIDDGYIQGRQLGFRVMMLYFNEAWKNKPNTVDEAMAMLQVGNPDHQ